MTSETRSGLMLTGPQADCLAILRNPGYSQSKIAIEAKRSMKEAEAALRGLAELGLAEQTGSKLWVATPHGETCSFETVPDRPKRETRPPRSGAQPLLDLLDGRAPPQRLPVRSDRVRKVLQEISDAGALRIRDVKDLTKIPQRSINALMQYLKRKQLVTKAGIEPLAPYSLTEQGRAVLVEMIDRRAA